MVNKTPNDEFEALFNEGAALDSGEVTEDMAAGLDIEEALEEQAEAAGESGMESEAEEAAAGEVGEMMEGEGKMADAEMAPAAADAPALDIEKERQRLKSWEGRLKAREAEMKAREAEVSATSALKGSDDTAAAAVEAATAAMETQPIDEAMATLAEDFGDDFVSALTQVIESRAAEIARKIAGEKVGEVAGSMDQLIASLTNERARSHFEAIADAHPDFMEVAQSPEFKQWIASMGDKAEKAQAIADGGSARQVIKLLNEFKAAGQGNDEPEAAMMAAQTVKSRGGMRLPAKPEASDDYEAAWNSFS